MLKKLKQCMFICACCWVMPLLGQSVPSQALGPGWQCLLVPTSFDEPGTILSIDSGGVERQVKDLARLKLVSVFTGSAGIGRLSSSQKLSGEASVSILEKLVKGFGGGIKAEGHRLNGATMEFGDVQLENTESQDFDPVVDKWFNAHVNPVRGVRYFVVRAAYKAGHVFYHFSKDDLLGLGGEGNFEKMFAAKADISRGAAGTYDMDQKFDPRLRVCIQASELVQNRGLNGDLLPYSVVSDAGGVPEIKMQEQPTE